MASVAYMSDADSSRLAMFNVWVRLSVVCASVCVCVCVGCMRAELMGADQRWVLNQTLSN